MTSSFQVRILIKGVRIPALSFNELGEKSQGTIISENISHRSKFKAHSHDKFFF